MKNQKQTVLIADDNALTRKSVRTVVAIFENLLVVGEAKNGIEAIDLAFQLIPDIVILDINMQPLDGFKTTSSIIQLNPNTKILGLSLHTHLEYATKMMLHGALGYVSKNSSFENIRKAIETVSNGESYIDPDLTDGETIKTSQSNAVLQSINSLGRKTFLL